jgi:VWFA-related protein
MGMRRRRRFSFSGIRHETWFALPILLLFFGTLPLSGGQGSQQQPSSTQQPAQQQPPATQPPSQEPTISVESKLVTVFANVRDKHGEIVSNLNKDDFTLAEDGRPQTITYFAKESDLPLTLGLLVDTSRSQTRVLDKERSASYSFLNDMLRPKDVAFIIHFDHEVELLQDLTSSQPKLDHALDLLKTPEYTETSDSDGHGRGHGGGTLLYDAIFLASDEVTKKQQGRKALIVLSDGVDRGSKETLETAIATAQRADTIVYSILFADEQGYGNYGGHGGGWGMGRPGGHRFPREERPDGKKVLERISKETGGRMFEVSKKETVDQIYASIEQELRSQYDLGYIPDKASYGGYHKIQVATTQKDLAVQARDGYYTDH